MNEQQLQDLIRETEQELSTSTKNLAKAKKHWLQTETIVIGNKIKLERLQEQLREYRATTPKYDPSLQDLEIEEFRENHADLVQWAKDRDEAGSKDK